ncbi:MAG: hypothetical protein DHS20C05_09760 [Hyphococcus sp.]|nr:MAG: hypothetical protein DHS20C05_09760 [Marinicaulis sp.]
MTLIDFHQKTDDADKPGMTALDGRIRPVKAARAFLKLMRNKEDSAQVVHFRTALDGDWHMPMARRFEAHPEGKKILDRGDWLFDTVTNTSYLASLPQGSLGRTYYETTHLKGFTPQGFRDQDAKGQDFTLLPPKAEFVNYRLIDMHDLLHTVTGYGRDGMGEICILEFQGIQFKSRGLRMLSYAAVTEVWKKYPDTPALKCVREANRIAKEATWMAVVDWESLLPRPIDEVREMLNMAPPEGYLAIHDLWQERDREMKEELAAAA